MASREQDEDITLKGNALWAALKSDSLVKEQVRLLLDFGAPANFREPDSRQTGRTPLHYVIGEKDGDDELIDMLLTHGADTNLGDSFNITPLYLAAEKGNLGAVQKLVNNPYSPADRNRRNRSDETPSQVATRMNQKSVSHYLQNYDANAVDVYSDGDGKVNVSTSTGSSVTVISPGRTMNVNLVVGDNSTMNINN